jgi:predicted secreted protein
LALVLMAALAGCSTTQWDEMRANPRKYFNLVAPTVVTDARVEGQQVTLDRWQALVVRLDEDTSTGERWEMQPLASSTVIAPVQHDLVGRPGTAPSAGPGEAVFRLRGVAAGTQPVVFALKRPFEPAASRTIRFDVVVR